ncbi:Gp138 family membrane-puncturing spike protein [Clostridium botulinum]|uniref:Gp138 family membrane-puncturing spike protein n=1 Tax=Clostridium botulinum TaxID=1491 RepID=UPI00096F136B|nr:Gp138 family membrane-puncturing spike protein [Clostridium botulinum]
MRNRNLNEIIGSDTEMFRSMGDGWKNVLRVACPGIIQSFDSEKQTVTVQLALREHITKPDFTKEWVNLPLLLDVAIVIPRAGDYCLTMPVKQGDECLIIFADMCIDAWFTYGNVQNQIEKRRHDLSDGFAILGTWSQPNRIENYSMDSCQLRTIDGTTSIDIKPGEINMNASKVKANGKDVLTREI